MSGRNLVDVYLADLTTAAGTLPAGRGTELVADVREHIETALGTAVTADEATVRNVLDRLGSPAEIVAAERDEEQPLTPVAPAGRRSVLTLARVAVAVLAGIVVLLLAVMSGTSGPAAAVMALAFAVVTPYVWIPLVLALFALALRKERGPLADVPADAGAASTSVNRRRPSPSLVGLAAIVVLLFVAFFAGGLGEAGVVAVLVLPILVLLLLVEVLRGRDR